MSDTRAVRVGDRVLSLCKPKKKSGVFVGGSPNTFVNMRPQIRLFDSSKPGPGPAISGSSRTFVNSRPAVRVKDRVLCGRIVNGSNNTFIG